MQTTHVNGGPVMQDDIFQTGRHGWQAVAAAVMMVLALSGAAQAGAETARAEAAWVPEPPAVARHAAAYVTLLGGAEADRLVEVSSQAAEVAEIHETSMAGGVLRMRTISTLPLAAGQRIEFAPGGYHIMLVNVRQPLQAGAHIPLELRFEKAGRVHLEAEVRSLPPTTTPSSDPAHLHHHH